APNGRYQDPNRSEGLSVMLKNNGFKLYLIDEYKTSSFCKSETMSKMRNADHYMSWMRYATLI
ncbi:uncharacterized protein EV154DRAFT_428856, partial [Mucor mucedo]|uniref:uncharacterized protein n=1 Tax=Mucor mucedo TaxID=29922 RepID=UPI00221EAFBF